MGWQREGGHRPRRENSRKFPVRWTAPPPARERGQVTGSSATAQGAAPQPWRQGAFRTGGPASAHSSRWAHRRPACPLAPRPSTAEGSHLEAREVAWRGGPGGGQPASPCPRPQPWGQRHSRPATSPPRHSRLAGASEHNTDLPGGDRQDGRRSRVPPQTREEHPESPRDAPRERRTQQPAVAAS